MGGRITGVVGITTRRAGRPGAGELTLGVGGGIPGGAGKAPAVAGAAVQTVGRGFGARDLDGVAAVGAAVAGGIGIAPARAVGGAGRWGGSRRASLTRSRRDVRRSVPPTNAAATRAATTRRQTRRRPWRPGSGSGIGTRNSGLPGPGV